MGNMLFGKNISKMVNKALGKKLLSATITRYTEGTRTSSDLSAGTNPTASTHTCRGIVEDYEDKLIDGTLVQQGDRKILILEDSIKPAIVPQADDVVTIEGTAYTLIGIPKRDPAAATYVCQGR